MLWLEGLDTEARQAINKGKARAGPGFNLQTFFELFSGLGRGFKA